MTIRFSPEAEADLAALIEYLADKNPRAAGELRDRILSVIDKLATHAFEGTEQMLANGATVRSWPSPPVRIFYRHEADAFWVVRIYHHARAPITR